MVTPLSWGACLAGSSLPLSGLAPSIESIGGGLFLTTATSAIARMTSSAPSTATVLIAECGQPSSVPSRSLTSLPGPSSVDGWRVGRGVDDGAGTVGDAVGVKEVVGALVMEVGAKVGRSDVGAATGADVGTCGSCAASRATVELSSGTTMRPEARMGLADTVPGRVRLLRTWSVLAETTKRWFEPAATAAPEASTKGAKAAALKSLAEACSVPSSALKATSVPSSSRTRPAAACASRAGRPAGRRSVTSSHTRLPSLVLSLETPPAWPTRMAAAASSGTGPPTRAGTRSSSRSETCTDQAVAPVAESKASTKPCQWQATMTFASARSRPVPGQSRRSSWWSQTLRRQKAVALSAMGSLWRVAAKPTEPRAAAKT
mmetsp:Transcript_5037/g.16152  ORF Transcript_5037/g.16152 Transcript_5037/m.16152 type:complete len:375 (-) Transcript_5037:634-1758(-)